MKLFKVVKGFPRIIDLEEGVGDVSYSVTLSSCTDFIVGDEELASL